MREKAAALVREAARLLIAGESEAQRAAATHALGQLRGPVALQLLLVEIGPTMRSCSAAHHGPSRTAHASVACVLALGASQPRLAQPPRDLRRAARVSRLVAPRGARPRRRMLGIGVAPAHTPPPLLSASPRGGRLRARGAPQAIVGGAARRPPPIRTVAARLVHPARAAAAVALRRRVPPRAHRRRRCRRRRRRRRRRGGSRARRHARAGVAGCGGAREGGGTERRASAAPPRAVEHGGAAAAAVAGDAQRLDGRNRRAGDARDRRRRRRGGARRPA